MFTTLYAKCLDLAAHKSCKYYLAIISFVESSFFPIPPDVMVIPMVISKRNDSNYCEPISKRSSCFCRSYWATDWKTCFWVNGMRILFALYYDIFFIISRSNYSHI